MPTSGAPEGCRTAKIGRGRGRPISVGGKPIIAKMPPALVAAIEAADSHGTNSSDAMRHLIELGSRPMRRRGDLWTMSPNPQ